MISNVAITPGGSHIIGYLSKGEALSEPDEHGERLRITDIEQLSLPSSANPPSLWLADRHKRPWWAKAGVLILVAAASGWLWWLVHNAPGGDPNGRILAQVRTTSQLPIPGLVITNVSGAASSRIESCAGQRGWTPVVTQTDFTYRGSARNLMQAMRAHFDHDGWRLSTAPSPTTTAAWRLREGPAQSSLAELVKTGPAYILTISAQPPGPIAPGCG